METVGAYDIGFIIQCFSPL